MTTFDIFSLAHNAVGAFLIVLSYTIATFARRDDDETDLREQRAQGSRIPPRRKRKSPQWISEDEDRAMRAADAHVGPIPGLTRQRWTWRYFQSMRSDACCPSTFRRCSRSTCNTDAASLTEVIIYLLGWVVLSIGILANANTSSTISRRRAQMWALGHTPFIALSGCSLFFASASCSQWVDGRVSGRRCCGGLVARRSCMNWFWSAIMVLTLFVLYTVDWMALTTLAAHGVSDDPYKTFTRYFAFIIVIGVYGSLLTRHNPHPIARGLAIWFLAQIAAGYTLMTLAFSVSKP